MKDTPFAVTEVVVPAVEGMLQGNPESASRGSKWSMAKLKGSLILLFNQFVTNDSLDCTGPVAASCGSEDCDPFLFGSQLETTQPNALHGVQGLH